MATYGKLRESEKKRKKGGEEKRERRGEEMRMSL
jgi:hypothetical protein